MKFKVGDKVRFSNMSVQDWLIKFYEPCINLHIEGGVGRIHLIDEDSQPYLVEFDNGVRWWCFEDELTKVEVD